MSAMLPRPGPRTIDMDQLDRAPDPGREWGNILAQKGEDGIVYLLEDPPDGEQQMVVGATWDSERKRPIGGRVTIVNRNPTYRLTRVSGGFDWVKRT